jgi:hypothetical protein
MKKVCGMTDTITRKKRLIQLQLLVIDYKYLNINLDIYFDVKSNMVFEPGTTYFYQRLGSNYIQKVINGKQDKVIKDTFNLTFTGKQVENNVY